MNWDYSERELRDRIEGPLMNFYRARRVEIDRGAGMVRVYCYERPEHSLSIPIEGALNAVRNRQLQVRDIYD